MVSGCGGMRPHLAGAIGDAGPRICHSEERSDVGISCNSPRIRRGFLVIQLSTARLPRPLRGLAMTNLRTGAVGGAISGRHCPSERAIVKTATAPDLSFRGAKRRGNLGEAVALSPGLSCVPGVYCEIAAAPAEPRNDKLGGLLPSEERRDKLGNLPHSKERNDKAGRLARFSYSSPFSSVLEIASTPMTRLPSSMRMRMTPWVSRP